MKRHLCQCQQFLTLLLVNCPLVPFSQFSVYPQNHLPNGLYEALREGGAHQPVPSQDPCQHHGLEHSLPGWWYARQLNCT